MQSSIGLAIRTAVMLIFLVSIPMLAIFGPAFPEVVRLMVQKQLSAWRQSDVPGRERPAAPAFAGAAEPRLRIAPTATQIATSSQPPQLLHAQQAQTPAAPPAFTMQPDPFSARVAAGPVETVNFEVQTPASPIPLPAAANSAVAKPSIPELRQRIEQLGATWYRLEQWGETGDMYRFACQVEVDPNTGLKRQFEAVTASPDEALIDVLAQIETWRSGR